MHLLVLSTLICASFISNIAAQQPSPTSPPAPPPSTLSDIVSAINADLQGPKKCYYDCYNSVNILRIPSFVTTDTVTDFCLDFLFQPQPSADAITRLNMCISTPACISGLQKVGSNSVDIGSACSNLYRLGLMGPSTRSMMIPPRLPTGSVPSSTPPRTIRPAPTAIPDIITAINEVITKPPKCYFTCLAAEVHLRF
ncbi:hypothetical protein BC829DRAFT_449256 [Chytridium lagenaria]|nr:hypothetical protein BC829DRAFT_449256 [Chytridium lagenaria]